MPLIRDVSRIVQARRAVARSAALARVIAYPLLVIGGANAALGRLPALALVALALIMLWGARWMVSGARAGAVLVAAIAIAFVLLGAGVLVAGALQEGPSDGALSLLGGAAVCALPGAWLGYGALQALRCRDPAVVRELARTGGGEAGVRALIARRRRVGVRPPLAGGLLLVAVTILLTPATNGLIGLLLGPPAAGLYHRAKVRAALDAQGVMDADLRPPVLYLRSFADEELAVRARWHRRRSLVDNWTAWHERLEEVLARQLAAYGPVVAIGMPGERDARLGAAREYVSDEGWQTTIVERMQRAGIIAVTIGRSEGLQWEMSTAARLGALGKCVFIFPGVPAAEVDRRWNAVREAVGTEAGAAVDAQITAAALTAVPTQDGVVVVTGRRRDEWNYGARGVRPGHVGGPDVMRLDRASVRG